MKRTRNHRKNTMKPNLWTRFHKLFIVLFVLIFGIIGYIVLRNSLALNANIDGIGVVDSADLAILVSNYGRQSMTFGQGDIDGDTKVDGFDASALLTNWGNGGGGTGTEQAVWAAAGTPPLTDAAAAAKVVHKPEQRVANATTNNYVPTATEISTFKAKTGSNGTQTALQYNTLLNYVTGKPGLTTPSTDDLIQWVSYKWGIPTDLVRAVMVKESNWNQSMLGERVTVSSAWYTAYPAAARIPSTLDIYQSMGISQIMWRFDGTGTPANGSRNPGTDPLRYKSTAFALDYWAATVRFYFDGLCPTTTCTPNYTSGQQLESIGAWYNPSPWNGSAAQTYTSQIQTIQSAKPWLQTGF